MSSSNHQLLHFRTLLHFLPMVFMACATTPPANPPEHFAYTSVEAEVPYDRRDWKHWSDLDDDCQDTRQEMLIESSTEPFFWKDDEKKCRVVLGAWLDIYTGETIEDASSATVDHVVSLKDAHISGGWAWDPGTKESFANDPRNLVITGRSANSSKGSRGPDEWLPPLPEARCPHIRRWLAVKKEYELEMEETEEALVNYMLKTCDAGAIPVRP
jgi:hypothetical protein